MGNTTLRNRLIGDSSEFSVENRVFNYICVASAIILIYCFLFNWYIGQYFMLAVIGATLGLLSVVYYFARIKKKFQSGIVICASVSYLLLIVNYFANFGVNGPTLLFFFLTFHLLIAVGRQKLYPLWLSLHISVVFALLLMEYLHPEWVRYTYRGRTDRFLDMAFAYAACIGFIYAIVGYIRKSFNNERQRAEERERAIEEQNKLILDQYHLLEKVNQEKNKLFSIISHDLRSPLDSIVGYLVLLSENQLSEDERTEMQDQLLTQTKYTSDLLLNLLSWAKTQMEGVQVHFSPVQLKSVVETITNNKLSFAAKKGIKITHSLDPALEVIADRDMLVIVLRNLINNAIKFTNPGGEVVIKALKKGDQLELSISDNGIGIPADKQEELFTLKTQSTYGTNNEKGIGLGLKMCREFMIYQKGNIYFESKEGEGSTFYISLPVAKL